MSLDGLLYSPDTPPAPVLWTGTSDETVGHKSSSVATQAVHPSPLGPAKSWRAALMNGPDTPRQAELITVWTRSTRHSSAVGDWPPGNSWEADTTWTRWAWNFSSTRSEIANTLTVDGLASHVATGSDVWRVVTDAVEELRRCFPGKLELRVERIEYNDGGGPEGGELFFVIGTELGGVAAYDRLEAFMDEFWLAQMQAHPNLPIPTIELL